MHLCAVDGHWCGPHSPLQCWACVCGVLSYQWGICHFTRGSGNQLKGEGTKSVRHRGQEDWTATVLVTWQDSCICELTAALAACPRSDPCPSMRARGCELMIHTLTKNCGQAMQSLLLLRVCFWWVTTLQCWVHSSVHGQHKLDSVSCLKGGYTCGDLREWREFWKNYGRLGGDNMD